MKKDKAGKLKVETFQLEGYLLMMYSVVERNLSLLTEKLVKPVSNIQIISRIGGYGMALGVPVLLLIVELPVPSFSVPFLSFTHPLPFPYPSLTHLASLGLPRPRKGMGTDTVFDFSHHHQ